MVPQLVLFIGDEFNELISVSSEYIKSYIGDKADIRFYKVLLDENDKYTISSNNKTMVCNQEDFEDNLDLLYQKINSLAGADKQSIGYLHITVVSSSIIDAQYQKLLLCLYNAVTNLYKRKKYPILFSWMVLTKQVHKVIDNIKAGSTFYSWKDITSIQKRFAKSDFTSNIVVLDNQNINGKGLNLTLPILVKILAEYFVVLSTNELNIFNTWKPIVYTFSLSSISYDLPWVKNYIRSKLYLRDIVANNLYGHVFIFKEYEEVIDEIGISLTDKICVLTDRFEKALLKLKNEGKYTCDDIEDIKSKHIVKLRESLVLEKLDELIGSSSLTLVEKIKILEVILGKYDLPEGSQMISTLDYNCYQLIKRYKFLNDQIELPSYLDILNKVSNSEEQYQKLKTFFLKAEYKLVDVQAKKADYDECISIIEEKMHQLKSQHRGIIFLLSKLVKSKRYQRFTTEMDRYKAEIKEVKKKLGELQLLDSVECAFLIQKIVYELVYEKLNVLHAIQNHVDDVNLSSKSFIESNRASHTLINYLEAETDFYEFISKEINNISYKLTLDSKVNAILFIDSWIGKNTRDLKRIYERYLKHVVSVRKWLVDMLSSNNLAESEVSLLKSVFDFNLAPFMHIIRDDIQSDISATFILLNYNYTVPDEEMELQSLLKKYMSSQPTICWISDPYKIISISFYEIMDLSSCSAFRE